MNNKKDFWYGFDFDGTLSKGREGKEPTLMVYALRDCLNHGYKCKIFTARVGLKNKNVVRRFLKAQNLPQLEITNKKDKYLITIVDNRAIGVVRDEGTTHYSIFGKILKMIAQGIDDHRHVKNFNSHIFDEAINLCNVARKSFERECAKYGSNEHST